MFLTIEQLQTIIKARFDGYGAVSLILECGHDGKAEAQTFTFYLLDGAELIQAANHWVIQTCGWII